ncbi:MAG: hypothetical protein ACKVT1_04130 [Dehalococcoidia bacterium]
MVTRAALHELLDAIPDEALEAASAALGAVQVGPAFGALFSAPEDDEPVTEEEQKLINTRWTSFQSGHHQTDEQARTALGLT